MNPTSSSPLAVATASGGIVGAVAYILCWLISLAHVTVPPEVVASFMVVGTPVLHYVALRIGAEPKAPVVAADKPVVTP